MLRLCGEAGGSRGGRSAVPRQTCSTCGSHPRPATDPCRCCVCCSGFGGGECEDEGALPPAASLLMDLEADDSEFLTDVRAGWGGVGEVNEAFELWGDSEGDAVA